MENRKLEETAKKFLDSLTDEQKEKVKACKNGEELQDLIAKEGVELPDELMENVAGGGISFQDFVRIVVLTVTYMS